MEIVTTYILKANEGKILQNKKTSQMTPSVWLKIGEEKNDWEEIDPPTPEKEQEEEE